MLLKKGLCLAIDLITCKETGPKINIVGGRGYPSRGQRAEIRDQERPARLEIVHGMIVRRGKVIICSENSG